MTRHEIENLLESHRYQEALDQLAQRNPSSWKDTSELRCLRALGRNNDALRIADLLYKTELNTNDKRIDDPQLNAQLRYIALVFSEQSKVAKACKIFQALCDRTPDSPILRREYASALAQSGKIDGAEAQLLIATELEPNNVETQLRLGSIYRHSARIDQALNCYYRAATLEPNNLRHLQRIANWSNYSRFTSRQSSFHLAKLWNDRIRTPNIIENDRVRLDTSDRITIGFLITANYPLDPEIFINPLLRTLDRSKFKVACYIDSQRSKTIKQQVAKCSDTCHDSSKVSDSELASQIQRHNVNVLVDLTGIGKGNRIRVFNKQAAPIQVSWLGYPATTGLSRIQYRISDKICDPQFSSEHAYTEELLRLPNGLFTFALPDPSATRVVRDSNEPLTFAVFSDLSRASGLAFDLWAEALSSTPGSVLKLSNATLDHQNTRRQVTKHFHDRGISDMRLIFDSQTVSADNLEIYNTVDILLDTAPYNDAVQALYALSMGVPVVSFQSNSFGGQLCGTILERLNLSELLAGDVSAFNEVITSLAGDTEMRLRYKELLPKLLADSSICNHKQFAQEFGEAITTIWSKQCSENSRESTLELGSNPDPITEEER